MTKISFNEALHATKYVTKEDRGFDSPDGWLHPATLERATDSPQEAIRAILAGIAATAGYFSSCDCPDVTDGVWLRTIAQDFEDAAQALREIIQEPSDF